MRRIRICLFAVVFPPTRAGPEARDKCLVNTSSCSTSLSETKACAFNDVSVFPLCQRKVTPMIIWGPEHTGPLEDLCVLAKPYLPSTSGWSREHFSWACGYVQGLTQWHPLSTDPSYAAITVFPDTVTVSTGCLHFNEAPLSLTSLSTHWTSWMAHDFTSGYHKVHTVMATTPDGHCCCLCWDLISLSAAAPVKHGRLLLPVPLDATTSKCRAASSQRWRWEEHLFFVFSQLRGSKLVLHVP